MRRAARLDQNHKAIVEALREGGASVYSLASVGHGCPDLVVGYEARTFLVEVKNPATPYGRAGMNPLQRRFMETWLGAPVVVLRSPDEARLWLLDVRRAAAALPQDLAVRD